MLFISFSPCWQVKLEGLLLQSLESSLQLYCALCGQCLQHWACQIYVTVRQEALGISSLLDCRCFSPSQYQPTFSSMASLQVPMFLSPVIFSHTPWLLMVLSARNMEGYVFLNLFSNQQAKIVAYGWLCCQMVHSKVLVVKGGRVAAPCGSQPNSVKV